METNHLDVVDFGKAPDVEVHDDQRGRVWKKIEKEDVEIRQMEARRVIVYT